MQSAIKHLTYDDYETAARLSREILDKDPYDLEASLNLARSLEAMQCWNEAATAYLYAIAIAGGADSLLTAATRTLALAERWDEAVAFGRLAVQGALTPCEAHHYLELALSKTGQSPQI
jgi:Flp pilus assembly protein TadD